MIAESIHKKHSLRDAQQQILFDMSMRVCVVVPTILLKACAFWGLCASRCNANEVWIVPATRAT